MEKAAISTKGFLPFAPLLISASRQKDYSVNRDIIKASKFQNGKGWKGALVGPSVPIYLLKQCPLEQIAQACIQVVLECLQGWRLHNLAGQPVPVIFAVWSSIQQIRAFSPKGSISRFQHPTF